MFSVEIKCKRHDGQPLVTFHECECDLSRTEAYNEYYYETDGGSYSSSYYYDFGDGDRPKRDAEAETEVKETKHDLSRYCPCNEMGRSVCRPHGPCHFMLETTSTMATKTTTRRVTRPKQVTPQPNTQRTRRRTKSTTRTTTTSTTTSSTTTTETYDVLQQIQAKLKTNILSTL